MPPSDITILQPFRECLFKFLYINSKKGNKITISNFQKQSSRGVL